MDKSQQRLLWAFLIFILIIGGIWQFYPLETAQGRLNSLPLNGPNFQGQEIELTSDEKKFFDNINIVKRIYKIDDQYFFVTVLDGSRNRHIVHDPYYCFRGAGWTINAEKPYPLDQGMANLIDISKGDEHREALYWFSDGSKAYTAPMEYWWQTTLRRISLGHSGPEPILIMIQPMTKQTVDWPAITKQLAPLFEI